MGENQTEQTPEQRPMKGTALYQKTEQPTITSWIQKQSVISVIRQTQMREKSSPDTDAYKTYSQIMENNMGGNQTIPNNTNNTPITNTARKKPHTSTT